MLGFETYTGFGLAFGYQQEIGLFIMLPFIVITLK